MGNGRDQHNDKLVVVEGLDQILSTPRRDEVLGEVLQQAQSGGLTAVVTVSAEELPALDLHDPAIRLLDLDTRELKALSGCGLPHTDWVARILESARPQMP